MTQINFYNLQQESEQDRRLFACRLAEKAYSLGHRVCILTGDDTAASQLDSLLWSFSPTSFIPHEIITGDHAASTRVSVAVNKLPADATDVVINLSDDAVDDFESISRVNEIIIQDPELLEQARARFRYYHQAGTRPEMIKL